MVELDSIVKSFDRLKVLDSISIAFEENQVTAILGPSGCGKTTLLRLIAGTLTPETGKIIGLENHRISYLFQEPRLLPWENVYKNIEFVLYEHSVKKSTIIHELLEMVQLAEYRNFYPHELSGGMKQRVAIARAFAFQATFLLMDEPFQALDLGLKLNLLRAFRTLWSRDPRTAVFVTHDIQEAILLGDRIVLFSQRPARIEKTFDNPLPSAERRLDKPAIMELEREIYGLLLD